MRDCPSSSDQARTATCVRAINHLDHLVVGESRLQIVVRGLGVAQLVLSLVESPGPAEAVDNL